MAEAIDAAPIDARRLLWRNIVIGGGQPRSQWLQNTIRRELALAAELYERVIQLEHLSSAQREVRATSLHRARLR